LPEVKHADVPPSGPQRLPRAVGLGLALDLIVPGQTLLAARCADSGMSDCICDLDAVQAALEFADGLDFGRPVSESLLRLRPSASADVQTALSAWRARLAEMPEANDPDARQMRWNSARARFETGSACGCATTSARCLKPITPCFVPPASSSFRHQRAPNIEEPPICPLRTAVSGFGRQPANATRPHRQHHHEGLTACTRIDRNASTMCDGQSTTQ
jgi:hypothetical protein